MFLLLAIVIAVHPPKPDVSLKFKNITISQSLGLAKTFGIAIDTTILPNDFKFGRIREMRIEVRNRHIFLHANGFAFDADRTGEMIRWIKMSYDRKSKLYYMKSEALGGLIELEGILPP